MDDAEFLRDVTGMVSANDRRAWIRGLRSALDAARERFLLAWSTLALVGFVVYTFPPYHQWAR